MPIHSDDFFGATNVRTVPIENWLNWAGGCDKSVFVALPMIQRGSVWKPKQIIDLWDTLLRGMPMGSLIASTLPSGVPVRLIGAHALTPIPANGGLGLIDGQQRTLSMLIAWPWVSEPMDRTLWVDFADRSSSEHLFRLHVTTKNQPFGFQKASPDSKLSLHERYKAKISYAIEHSHDFVDAKPWDSVLPINVGVLIKLWLDNKNLSNTEWESGVVNLLATISRKKFTRFDANKNPEYKSITWDSFTAEEQGMARNSIRAFKNALADMFRLEIPLLKVESKIFDTTTTGEGVDPPLAVLFKRIGTGGTDLSNADYVYSVIKHQLPEAYTLVEKLHREQNIASLLSATDLVMTGVRLAAIEINTQNKALPDYEDIDKFQFHRMLKTEGFLENGFKPLLAPRGLARTFKALTELIQYRRVEQDIGLPLHAFPLLHRPLVQVLLRWVRLIQLQNRDDEQQILESNRAELIRFVMYWQLCVKDPKKASQLAFEKLKATDSSFNGVGIYKYLLEKQVTIPLFSPDEMRKQISGCIFSSKEAKLRGWRRFLIEPNSTDDVRNMVELYSKWWNKGNNYTHPLLLWLQRDMVATRFSGIPIASREEDTPYDYDHICPSSHWGDWTGSSRGSNRIIIYFIDNDDDRQAHAKVGNSIGNVRIWDSSDNRSDGDASPRVKLKLDGLADDRDEILLNSAIEIAHLSDWERCSADGENKRIWDEARTQAFQSAVEQRAFSLYRHYFGELGFSSWL